MADPLGGGEASAAALATPAQTSPVPSNLGQQTPLAVDLLPPESEFFTITPPETKIANANAQQGRTGAGGAEVAESGVNTELRRAVELLLRPPPRTE